MSLRSATRYNQRRASARTVAPTSEPITVGELRDMLRLPIGQEETVLQQCLITARETIERLTGLAIITQTWKLVLDNWPSGKEAWWDGVQDGAITELYSGGGPRWVEIPVYPLQSVSEVTTFNSAGDATIVSVSDIFDVDILSIRGRMILKDGQVWPAALRTTSAIQIVYVAGYGDSWSDVPFGVRHAVLQLAAYLYTHRGDCNAETAFSSSGASSLLGAYARLRL